MALAADPNPPLWLVRVSDAILDIVLASRSDCIFDRNARSLAIFFVQKLLHFSPRHLRPWRNAENIGCSFGHGRDVRFGIPWPVAKACGIESELQTVCGFVERTSCLSLLGNVACNLGGADDLSCRTLDR